MGLHKSKHVNKAHWMKIWLLPAIFIGVSALIMLAGEPGREWLRYDRVWIWQGESWRFLSGHFVHLSWSHFALNSAGLLLVWYLIGGVFSMRNWLLVILVTLATIDAGFWVLRPDLYWYVGMSGLLHGLLLAGIAARLRSLDAELGILLLLVMAKISYEQFAGGALPGSEATSGGPVVVDAHLFGAVGGILGALLAKMTRTSAPEQ